MARLLPRLATLTVIALACQAHADDKVLNIYSARHYQTDEAFYADFTKQTGIKINRLDGKEDELLERIKNEGANSPADILITVDAARLAIADQAGLFQPIQSKVLDEAIPSSDVMGKLKSGDARDARAPLKAGQSYAIEVEFLYQPARVHGLWYGIRRPDTPEAMLGRAVALAQQADAVILMVGETSDASVESKDRSHTSLPDNQLALIDAVTAANPRTIIVANVGHAFDTSWEEKAAALLIAWYPGEAFGTAIAQVLAGDREPGGRMPVSIARTDADYPALALTPDEKGDLRYEEGRRIGYRGMADPRHTLGAGFGYADIALDDVDIVPGHDGGLIVRAQMHNQSDRDGSDVIQIYRREPELALVAFAKVHLEPGERRQLAIPILRRRLQYWCTRGAISLLVFSQSRLYLCRWQCSRAVLCAHR